MQLPETAERVGGEDKEEETERERKHVGSWGWAARPSVEPDDECVRGGERGSEGGAPSGRRATAEAERGPRLRRMVSTPPPTSSFK